MRRGLSRTILVGAVVGSAVGALGVPAPTAAGAAGPTGWAVWSPLSGGANAYATTMHYLVDGLDAGAYVVELTPPTGFDVVGPVRRPADITAAGEIRGGPDFTVRAAEAGTTPPSTPSSPAVPLGGGSLSNSGARWDVPLAAGLLLVGTGAALVVAGTRRRRPRVTSRR